MQNHLHNFFGAKNILCLDLRVSCDLLKYKTVSIIQRQEITDILNVLFILINNLLHFYAKNVNVKNYLFFGLKWKNCWTDRKSQIFNYFN